MTTPVAPTPLPDPATNHGQLEDTLRDLADAPPPHVHTAANTTSGVFSTARLGTGSPSAGKYVDGGTGAWTTLPTGSIGGGTGETKLDWVFAKADGGALGDGSANDTTALQNLINNNTGKIIYFETGTYNVAQLTLPSDTHLELGNAIIRRTGNTSGAGAGTVRNSNTSTGNTNITVRGGHITSGSGSSGRAWVMNGVTNLVVQDLHISKGASSFADWMCYFQNCTHVRMDNIWISGGTAVGEDGLHIKSSQDMVINNLISEAGDDALVLVHEFNQTRPIKNIAISNVVLASQSANALRLGVWAGETQAIEDVTISNVSIRPAAGTMAGTCITIGDQTNTGLLRRINLSDFTVDATGYPGATMSITNMWDSTFTNWRIHGSSAAAIGMSNVQRSSFTNVLCDTPKVGHADPMWSLTNCAELMFTDCVIRNGSIWGFTITGTSSRDLTFVNCKVLNTPQPNWEVSHAARVTWIGCATDSGTPINCNTTNPPSNFKVIGCSFRGGGANVPVANAPASMIYLANSDNNNRGDQFNSGKVGFYGTTPVIKPAGVPVTAAGVHAALVSLGLISA
jgi:hypothetical protein